MTSTEATDPLEQCNFRHRRSKKLMLQAFASEDGHGELTRTLREAVDLYIDLRTKRGREAVRAPR